MLAASRFFAMKGSVSAADNTAPPPLAYFGLSVGF